MTTSKFYACFGCFGGFGQIVSTSALGPDHAILWVDGDLFHQMES